MAKRVVGTAVIGVFVLGGCAWAQLGGFGGGIGGGGGGGGGHQQTRSPDAGPEVAETPVLLGVGVVSVAEGKEISGLVVIGGADIAGEVTGDVTAIGGPVTLAATAVVRGNVTAVCASVTQAEGAKVYGEVQERQLEEMSVVDIGWPEPGDQVVRIGDVELRQGQENPIALIVLGGKVTVGKGVRAAEIIAIGGDVTIEKGADVAKVTVIGGKVTRPKGQAADEDEVVPAAVVACGTWQMVRGPASGSASTTITHAAPSTMLSVESTGRHWGQVTVRRPEGPGLLLDLRLASNGNRHDLRGFNQGPRPDGAAIDPKDQPDPLFRSSMAVSAGMSLKVTAATMGEGDTPLTSVERTITLGVPAGSEGLVGSADGGGYGRY